ALLVQIDGTVEPGAPLFRAGRKEQRRILEYERTVNTVDRLRQLDAIARLLGLARKHRFVGTAELGVVGEILAKLVGTGQAGRRAPGPIKPGEVHVPLHRDARDEDR